ncbi:hypothetical protein [Gottfriedia acidiceleris]|uniref:hypothetical protein n=1 Tax=Gottfriedia acidiceleris TaxID=371036 RepID=UPI00101C68FF|nr:hypothetical protein [Gottfriedia acidiceleris]
MRSFFNKIQQFLKNGVKKGVIMRMQLTNDYDGFDMVWIASDINGQLGAFNTFGGGPVPCEALNFPFEDIEEAVLRLSYNSGTHLLPQLPSQDRFIELVNRGFFVYDWSHSNSYKLYEVPIKPRLISELPDDLQKLADSIKFHIAFKEESELKVE